MSNLLQRVNSRIYPWIVWALRIAVGATFIFSGFAKIVDPWGFVFKLQDYLNVWGVHWLWREVVFCIAFSVAVFEFTAGVLLLTGCLRRAVCRLLTLMMLFMLPLTAYIAIANPVDDCGCFGEAWVISNNATFIKNVIITAALVYLLIYNQKVMSLYPPLIQWLVMVVSIAFCLVVGFLGVSVQPLVDFRPYPVGQPLIDDDTEQMTVIYQKDGDVREFELDDLPDSTWTYVGRNIPEDSKVKHFAVFDGDDEVTADVISDDEPQLLLVVTDPKAHAKARAGMANSLNSYVQAYGGSMIGIVATVPDSLDSWREMTNPNYDVYTADDTSLKELVRGDAALVYLTDGKVKWKRSIYSLPADFPDFESPDNELDKVSPIDDGVLITKLTVAYICILACILMLGLFRVLKKKTKKVMLFKFKHYAQ